MFTAEVFRNETSNTIKHFEKEINKREKNKNWEIKTLKNTFKGWKKQQEFYKNVTEKYQKS